MNKVLVVIDMQNDFIDGSLGTDEAKKIVNKVANKISRFNGKVIYTMDSHFENYLDTLEGKKLPVKHCIVGTEGWQMNEKIMKVLSKKRAVKVEKPTFGSFKLLDEIDNVIDELCYDGDPLSLAEPKMSYNDAINELKITLVGLCTDICITANAMLLRTKYPNVTIKVDSSCCAGVTPESHAAALKTMQMCQMDVI